MVPPGSVEMGPPSPRGPVFGRPRVDVADEEPPSNAAPTPEEPAAAPDDAEPAPPPPLSPLPPGVRVPQGEERDVLLARIQARVISSSSDSEASEELHDAAPLDEEDPEAAAPTATEAPPRHKPLQQRVSPRSVLLVPEEPDRTVDIDVYVEDEDEEHVDRLTTLRKRGYLAFYDRPPLMTVALVLSWIFVQRRRGYPPYDEDAYCLGPDTPFKTVFAHAYAHSSREHLYSNVVSMLLVGGVLEAVEGPLCVLCIFACAVPCGAAYHSLWKPHAFVRGASGGVYGVMAAHVSTMLMNWHEMPLRYFRLLACVLVLAFEIAGRYWYRQPNLGYAAHFGGAVGGAAAALVLVRNVRLRSVRRSARPSTCAPTPSTRRGAHRPIPAQDVTSSRSWSRASLSTRGRHSQSSTTPKTRGRRSAWRWSRRHWRCSSR
jgi:membrane associated rhomboid family serine protease